MRFGKIPSSVVLISAASKVFKCGWEDVDVSLAEDIEVIPSFVADAESKESIQQGLKWATNYNLGNRSSAVPVEVEETNAPRTLTVVGLEKRQEGGRSFKVLDSQNRLFDLREDVLLETMMSVGVTAGGALNGQFIFARVGSQIRLVRVGSSLHSEMLKSEGRRQSKNVEASTLVVGGVYANRRGLIIYLGRVDTVDDFSATRNQHSLFTAQAKSLWKAASATGTLTDSKPVSVLGEHLSIPLSKWDQAEPERALTNALGNPTCASMYQFGKTIAAVELVSRIEVPDNIIERLRMRACKHIDRVIAERKFPKFVDGFGEEAVTEMNRASVKEASAMLNLRAHGNGASESPEYKDLLKRAKI